MKFLPSLLAMLLLPPPRTTKPSMKQSRMKCLPLTTGTQKLPRKNRITMTPRRTEVVVVVAEDEVAVISAEVEVEEVSHFILRSCNT